MHGWTAAVEGIQLCILGDNRSNGSSSGGGGKEEWMCLQFLLFQLLLLLLLLFLSSLLPAFPHAEINQESVHEKQDTHEQCHDTTDRDHGRSELFRAFHIDIAQEEKEIGSQEHEEESDDQNSIHPSLVRGKQSVIDPREAQHIDTEGHEKDRSWESDRDIHELRQGIILSRETDARAGTSIILQMTLRSMTAPEKEEDRPTHTDEDPKTQESFEGSSLVLWIPVMGERKDMGRRDE